MQCHIAAVVLDSSGLGAQRGAVQFRNFQRIHGDQLCSLALALLQEQIHEVGDLTLRYLHGSILSADHIAIFIHHAQCGRLKSLRGEQRNECAAVGCGKGGDAIGEELRILCRKHTNTVDIALNCVLIHMQAQHIAGIGLNLQAHQIQIFHADRIQLYRHAGSDLIKSQSVFQIQCQLVVGIRGYIVSAQHADLTGCCGGNADLSIVIIQSGLLAKLENTYNGRIRILINQSVFYQFPLGVVLHDPVGLQLIHAGNFKVVERKLAAVAKLYGIDDHIVKLCGRICSQTGGARGERGSSIPFLKRIFHSQCAVPIALQTGAVAIHLKLGEIPRIGAQLQIFGSQQRFGGSDHLIQRSLGLFHTQFIELAVNCVGDQAAPCIVGRQHDVCIHGIVCPALCVVVFTTDRTEQIQCGL